MKSTDPIAMRLYGESGPEVSVLHGGPGAPGSVRRLAELLGSSRRVMEPLQRRAGSVALTVERHVADLAEVAPGRGAVVGWSWGAMLGMSYAALHPERVSRLVLVGCGTYDADSRRQYLAAKAERLGTDCRERLAALQARLAVDPDRRVRDRIFAEMGHMAGQAQAHDLVEPLPELPDVDADGFTETWTDVLALQDAGVEPARFSSVLCPVLMLHGTDDPHPGPSTRDTLRRFIPQLDYVEIAGCGHAPWLERHGREPFMAQLEDYLSTEEH